MAAVLATGGADAASPTAPSADDAAFFETHVRPLLVEHCMECHSAAAGDPEGGLAFDSRRAFLAAEGVAVPGKPDESLIVHAVRYDGDLQMPPDGRLPPNAVKAIEDWVRRGLPWPAEPDGATGPAPAAFDIAARKAEHWCWHPPQASAPPPVRDASWCRTDLDRFVLARLEAAGLAPAPEADRGVLVRRASEVLTGLPPEPADLAAAVADTDPRWFEHFVDRLLASPQYGERFARHWLDVVRYAETRGHEFDFPIPNAWRYRDWVVHAFNTDLPYDQFVREQIAGDLMDRPRLDPATGADRSVVGTGFWLLGEEVHAPVDIRQDEADRIDNRVDTFGKAFLGLALGCARCHDHKFDAISNEDYYAIAGMVMSSSYRQVPFETLHANRAVAAALDAHDAETRRAVAPLLAAVAGPGADAAAEPPPPSPAGQTVIADYTRGADSTPIIADGAAWGTAPVPAGAPVLLPIVEGLPRQLRVEPVGHARSDPVWSTTRSAGDRDPGPLGAVDRAGRVLRTPKARIAGGVIWHRIRGHVQIFTVVDSHVLLQGGPLHGDNVLTTDTRGEWRWVRQDLRKDIDWSSSHVVHVEYAAVAGEVGVATVVASTETPPWSDPSGPAAINERLGRADCDWTSAAARAAVAMAERRTDERAIIAARVRLVSATAPALLDGNGIDQHVLLKGSAARPGEVSPRRFLEAIDGPDQPAWPRDSSGRRALADRVLDPANPLTSRVLVNRVWHHLFGRGLVPTTDNFGVLGEAAADPVAQALLDTLAVRFRDEGFSVKRLVRDIVTSSTWRMSGTRDPRAVEHDPVNLLLHHHPLRRLEGEAIRDKILAVSGRLDRTVGGPPIEVFVGDFAEGRGRPASGPLDGAGRRSIYTRIRRNFLPGFMLAFDMPPPFQAMGRRTVTNVPAQALTLMNDPFVAGQAAQWGRRTLAEGGSPAEMIDRMYLRAFARPPRDDERRTALDFVAAATVRHGVDPASTTGQEAVWTDLAHALLNAKEFVFVP